MTKNLYLFLPIFSKVFLRFLSIATLLIFSACKDKSASESKTFAYTNDLIHETSPYLLQHAHNPVNWQPWSDDIYKIAQKEDKLVVLSIGYSTCHWCHKMEEETFMDLSTATYMNENFITIKVDREERPDVDKVYMTAVQLMNGSGGWPLNVITLPNGKPIYGGTYHTKEEWNKVLQQFTALYKNEKSKLNDYANNVAQGIQETNLVAVTQNQTALSNDSLVKAINKWKLQWDNAYGGTKADQKFVLPTNISFLMDYAVIENDLQSKNFVQKTLDSIASSGIIDHLDGGFYRYSTVPNWSIPHFEKMLYDNAQIMALFAKAYKLYRTPRYKEIVYDIDRFLQENMLYKGGAYYAALDADTDGEEGKYYTWSAKELTTILGSEYNLFASYYELSAEKTLENNKFILQHTNSDASFIKSKNLSLDELKKLKSKWKLKLKNARSNRTYPNKDDKIITSWNALLITGYLEAYKSFGDQSFLDKAEAINNFITKHCFSADNLMHTYKENSKNSTGFLEDYATWTNANINLYLVTLNPKYLDLAIRLTELTRSKFYDTESGFYSFKEDNNLISKIITTHDGVTESPNALIADNLFNLGHILYNDDYSLEATKLLQAMTPLLLESPESYTKWNMLFLKLTSTHYEVAIVGSNAKRIVQEFNSKFMVNCLILGSTTASDLPIFKDRFEKNDTNIYVCLNNSCKLPVKSVSEALQQIEYTSHKNTFDYGF